MYRVRCSKLDVLLAGCDKVRNKYEWSSLDKMKDSHIRMAIEIYNLAEYGFEPYHFSDVDMNAGNEHEPMAVKLYDAFNGTNYYPSYEQSREVVQAYERSNDWITGTRDFGDTIKTIDAKVSTDKNVFDSKKFMPVETEYVIQLNGYAWLYDTPENYLYNVLMPATIGQINKFVTNKKFVEMLTDSEADKYEEKLDKVYGYSGLTMAQRISIKPVPLIVNFQDTVKKRVEVMNNWIEKNKHNF